MSAKKKYTYKFTGGGEPRPYTFSIRSKFVAIAAWAVLGGIAFFARNAGAQELELPKPRQGYYVGLGAYGTLSGNYRTEEEEWLAPWPGVSGSLRLGEAINDWVDLGIGIAVGPSFSDNYLGLLGHLTMEVQLRPVEPLIVRAHVGFGFIDITRRKSGLEQVIGRVGGAYGLTLGWELFPFYDEGSGGFSITPVAGFEAAPGEPLATYMGFVGIEINFWTGLAKDKLDLPGDEAYE